MDEKDTLKKWNTRLQRMFIISKKYLKEILNIEDIHNRLSFMNPFFDNEIYKENPNKITIFDIKTFEGIPLIKYFIYDEETETFIKDMKNSWAYLEYCYLQSPNDSYIILDMHKKMN